VEERIIKAPVGTGTAPTGYPPVVDRSVGDARAMPSRPEGQDRPVRADQESEQPGTGQWRSAVPSETADQSRPTTSSANDRVNSAVRTPSGGVVAVPKIEPRTTAPTVTDRAPTVVEEQTGTQSEGIKASLSENDYYEQGFELLTQSKYEDAATVFEQQLKAYPGGKLAADAHYWIAEAMQVSRKIDVAKQHLKVIIKDYPQSSRLPDAMLKTAYIEQQLGNEIEARILFQEIVNYHPKSDAAIAAKNRLAASGN